MSQLAPSSCEAIECKLCFSFAPTFRSLKSAGHTLESKGKPRFSETTVRISSRGASHDLTAYCQPCEDAAVEAMAKELFAAGELCEVESGEGLFVLFLRPHKKSFLFCVCFLHRTRGPASKWETGKTGG